MLRTLTCAGRGVSAAPAARTPRGPPVASVDVVDLPLVPIPRTSARTARISSRYPRGYAAACASSPGTPRTGSSTGSSRSRPSVPRRRRGEGEARAQPGALRHATMLNLRARLLMPYAFATSVKLTGRRSAPPGTAAETARMFGSRASSRAPRRGGLEIFRAHAGRWPVVRTRGRREVSNGLERDGGWEVMRRDEKGSKRRIEGMTRDAPRAGTGRISGAPPQAHLAVRGSRDAVAPPVRGHLVPSKRRAPTDPPASYVTTSVNIAVVRHGGSRGHPHYSSRERVVVP